MSVREVKREFYKLSDTAKILGVTVRTLREWIKAKPPKLNAYKYGASKMWYVKTEEIEKIKSEMKEV